MTEQGRTTIWAVGMTRNEADIVRVNVLHHLDQGIDRILLLDNDSTDGTPSVLSELSRALPVEWRPRQGHYRQDELVTDLAREAFIRGADWVLPVDADEFWYAPGSSIRAVLENTRAGALRVHPVSFVQRREQLTSSPDALLTMTRRSPEAVGSIDRIAALVESGEIAFVEHRYAPKWIARACPMLEIGWGSHTISGAREPSEDTDAIVCLHAPLRSRAALEQKIDASRPIEELSDYLQGAWHIRRWRRIAAAGRLDAEWHANSYSDDRLDLYGTSRPLVIDTRLRDLVSRWIVTSPPKDAGELGAGTRETTNAVPPEPAASARQPDTACEDAFPRIRRYPTAARVWGVLVVRNEADILRVNALHHLWLGCEKLLIADDESTDGTAGVLEGLVADSRIEWRRLARPFRRADVLTGLAREAFGRGATWVLPLEAGEFWLAEEGDLLRILEEAAAGAFSCPVVNFVQGRDEIERRDDSLARMIFRPRRPIGPGSRAEQLVRAGRAAVVEVAECQRWIARATPRLSIGTGHRIAGVAGTVEHTRLLTCLRAPVRARSVLDAAAEDARRLAAANEGDGVHWSHRRWLELVADEEAMAREWRANSHENGLLEHEGAARPLVEDRRLQQVASRWIAGASESRPARAVEVRSDDGRPHRRQTPDRPHREPDRTKILASMRGIPGWLTENEAALLMRATDEALSSFGGSHAIVEVGSYFGRSTVVIAGTAAASGEDVTVYAVDPHLGDVGALDSDVGVAAGRPTFEEFSENMIRAGVNGVIAPVLQHSFEVEWSRAISFIFIDGLHDSVSVSQDGGHFLDWVVDGGLAAFHDYSDLFPGVRNYVDRLAREGGFEVVEQVEMLIVLRKTGMAGRAVTGDAASGDAASDGSPAGALVEAGPGSQDLAAPTSDDPADLLEAELRDHQIEASMADAELLGLRSDLAHSIAVREALNTQLAQHRRHLAAKTVESDSLRSEAERGRQVLAAVSDEATRQRRRAAAVEREAAVVSAELDGARSQLARQEAEAQALRAARTRADDLARQLQVLTPRAAGLARELARTRHALQYNEHLVQALRASLSWRCTAPLRAGLDVLLRAKKQVERPRRGGPMARTSHAEPSEAASTPAPGLAAPGAGPGKPRFLVVTDAVPTPDLDAGSFRLFQILTLLTEIGYAVTLVSDSAEPQPEYVKVLTGLGVASLLGYEAATEHLTREGHEYRYVLLSRPEPAFRYLFPVRGTAIHARVAYDTVDLHWVRLGRGAEVTGDPALAQQAGDYRRMELFNAASSDVVIATTESDRQLLLEGDPALRIELLPTIHPRVATARSFFSRRDLMFIGGFWHSPNEDAVLYFVRDILPIVRRHLPDVVFNIVGSRMPDSVKALESPSVRPIGYVPDPAPYFESCRVFVSPLRYGAGMKGKIGQSMSFGLPVVTTSIGAEGMLLVDGENALVADGPEAFAQAVVRLYSDERLWERITAAAVAHIERHFSKAAARRRLEALFPIDAGPPWRGPADADRLSR